MGKKHNQALENWNKAHENNTTHSTTNVEQNPSNEPMAKEKAQGFNSPVRIVIHSYRKRLADSDGISAKAAIDGLVKAGLLKDDSPKYVEEVAYRQYKSDEEKTVIDIEKISSLRKKLKDELATLIPYFLEEEWIDDIMNIFGY